MFLSYTIALPELENIKRIGWTNGNTAVSFIRQLWKEKKRVAIVIADISWKESVFGIFLVHIFPQCRLNTYLVQIRKNMDKKNSEYRTLHAMWDTKPIHFSLISHFLKCNVSMFQLCLSQILFYIAFTSHIQCLFTGYFKVFAVINMLIIICWLLILLYKNYRLLRRAYELQKKYALGSQKNTQDEVRF